MMKEIQIVYQKILEELDQVSDVCKDGRIKKLWKDIQHLNDLYEKYFYTMMKRLHDKNPKEHASSVASKFISRSPPHRSGAAHNDTKSETMGSTDLKKLDTQSKSLRERFMMHEYQDEIMKEVDRKFKDYDDRFHVYEQEKRALYDNTKKMREELDKLKAAGNFFSRQAIEQEREEEGASDTTSVENSAKQIANLTKELNFIKEKKAEDLKKYQAELNSLKEQIKLIISTKEDEKELLRNEVHNLKNQLDMNRKQADKNLKSLKLELQEERQNATAESQRKDRIIASEQAKIASCKKIIDNLNLKLKEKQKSPDPERPNNKDSSSKEPLRNRTKMNKDSPLKKNVGRSTSPRDDRFQGIQITESGVKAANNKKSREKSSREADPKVVRRSLSLPKDATAYEQNVHDTPQERELKKNILFREKNIQFLWKFVKKLRGRLTRNIKNQQELKISYRERVVEYENTIKMLKSQLDSLIFQISNKDRIFTNQKANAVERKDITEAQVKSKRSPIKFNESEKKAKLQSEKHADEYVLPKSDPGVIMYHGDSNCSESDQDLIKLMGKGE